MIYTDPFWVTPMYVSYHSPKRIFCRLSLLFVFLPTLESIKWYKLQYFSQFPLHIHNNYLFCADASIIWRCSPFCRTMSVFSWWTPCSTWPRPISLPAWFTSWTGQFSCPEPNNWSHLTSWFKYFQDKYWVSNKFLYFYIAAYTL